MHDESAPKPGQMYVPIYTSGPKRAFVAKKSCLASAMRSIAAAQMLVFELLEWLQMTQRRHSLSQACTLGYALTDCSRLLADLRRCRSLHQGNDRSRSQPRNVSWCCPSDIARFSQKHLVRPAATLVNRCRTTDRSVVPNRRLRNQAPKLQRMSGKFGYSNDMLLHTVRLILDWPGTRGRTETAAKR